MHVIVKALRALPEGRYLLAVSGGRDSMALLHAFAASRADALSAVATFDHGTGAAASAAVDLVVHECLLRSIPVVAARAPNDAALRHPSESRWRAARWSFLHAVADEWRATIVTAHTLDDQAETVAMRILRGASARGLAGMAVTAPGLVRPLLEIRRAQVGQYAVAFDVPFVEDPSNADAGYLRNRLRSDVLAAAERSAPGFSETLSALGARAARWRTELAVLVDQLGARRVGEAVVIAAEMVVGLTSDSLRVVWPELSGRVGVVMDRRGIERVTAWTPRAQPGQRMPLSGGATVERTARTFVVRGGAVMASGTAP